MSHLFITLSISFLFLSLSLSFTLSLYLSVDIGVFTSSLFLLADSLKTIIFSGKPKLLGRLFEYFAVVVAGCLLCETWLADTLSLSSTSRSA